MLKLSKAPVFLFFLTVLLLIRVDKSYSQEVQFQDSVVVAESVIIRSMPDSTLLPGGCEIDFNLKQAIGFVDRWYRAGSMWNDRNDPLRKAMARLLFEATNDPFYNSELFLREFDWGQIKISPDNFFLWDTIQIKVPFESVTSNFVNVDSIAITDTNRLTFLAQHDSLLIISAADSLKQIQVTDTIILVVSDTLKEVFSTDPGFPFRYYNYPLTGDSIQAAIEVLLADILMRDSTMVVFSGSNSNAPLWISSNNERLVRLWLENEWGENISIWIGRGEGDTIKVSVEEGVHFSRLNKETNFAQAQIDVKKPDNTKLADAKMVEFTPNYWKFLYEAAFTFNQAMLKNWPKGGESNIAITTDLQGVVDYTNEEKKVSFTTVGRFKFGYMALGDFAKRDGFAVRKNVDQVDIASKYNTKAFGEFNFSATMIFKTQVARGYAYPNDSVMISRFFNPATLTLGFGLEYELNENTSINFAPLAYKGTYVPDTVRIDQTKHGLLADQRARHEPGISAQIDHKLTLLKDITIINKVRLFTNYIHKPQNIDIEWEMIVTAKLNWFTDLRLNTHFIYDDDTLIPLFNDDGTMVLGSDGIQKKVPLVQFKEILGVSIIFRF